MTAAGAKHKGRDWPTAHALGGSLFTQIKQAKVLMVGAGGIGCELLKNLVLTGFGHIEIVDLDTIDLSNLNRQFLFRHEHIKKSKALIAKETASKFNPKVQIEAHHANIKDKNFDVDWFRSFRLVFNALDNLDARRHVNAMCLAADVPLLESGTTGFEGQVQSIVKGVTECYDCNPKPVPKSYPVCTIRSTPSQPIHCIVWAKSYLFQEVFGISEEDEKELDHTEDAENADEVKQLKQEAGELKEIRASVASDDFAEKVFTKVFDTDIERLRGMHDMWKSRTPPNALKWAEESQSAAKVQGHEISQQDQVTWNKEQNMAVFISSMSRLAKRLRSAQASDPTSALIFDKDDKDTLDFVAAAANLRSTIFGIEAKSEFDIKQMAGNIIPAIATTNAMTASLCVLQAMKILRGQTSKAKMAFLAPRNPVRMLNSEPPRPPNRDCAVCNVAVAEVQIDTARAKVSDLLEGVLKNKLKYTDEVSINAGQTILYDPEFPDNLDKKLADFSVGDGTTLTVLDEDDGEDIPVDGAEGTVKAPRVNLSLLVKQVTLEDGDPIVLPRPEVSIGRRPRKSAETPAPQHSNGTNGVQPSQKRKREADGDDVGDAQQAKKAKAGDDDDDLVLVDEQQGDGAIVID